MLGVWSRPWVSIEKQNRQEWSVGVFGGEDWVCGGVCGGGGGGGTWLCLVVLGVRFVDWCFSQKKHTVMLHVHTLVLT